MIVGWVPIERVTVFVGRNESGKTAVPVFIYFENYGILNSAIYFPRLLEDLSNAPDDPRVRTINAMFKHVGLSAQEIAELGSEQAQEARSRNQKPSVDTIAKDQQSKEARAIKLNSASLDITERFNEWYGQRRHTIDYQADGNYFRIWIADDRRPGVRIELESRSKGFQWFFSFYLVFLVESDEGHKEAILLLDEPGLHLHPTAQQELIAFFERLSEVTSSSTLHTRHFSSMASIFIVSDRSLRTPRATRASLRKAGPATEKPSSRYKQPLATLWSVPCSSMRIMCWSKA
jgi:predicted ATP-dependent endonuclease of OLD family